MIFVSSNCSWLFKKYIFCKCLNNDPTTLTKADYIKQISKVKHTYERFKMEHDLPFYFPAIFKQVS